MGEKAETTRLMLEKLGIKEKAQIGEESNFLVFEEDPGNYSIEVTQQDMVSINKLIRESAPSAQVLRKNATYVELPSPKYTLLIVESGIYLIGDGKRKDKKNAFLGSGTNFGSTVKVCVKLEEENGEYHLTHKLYAVKKYNKVLPEMEKEIGLMKKIYGFGEILFDDKKDKTYLLMPKIPGVELANVNFQEVNERELMDIVANIIKELVTINKQKILHGDVNPKNIFYDRGSGRVYFTDFGSSKEVEEVNLKSDFDDLAFSLFDLFANYLTKHVNSFDLDANAERLQEEFSLALAENLISVVLEALKNPMSDNIKELIFTHLEDALLPLELDLSEDKLSQLTSTEVVSLMKKCIHLEDTKTFKKLSTHCEKSILEDHGKELLTLAHNSGKEKMVEQLKDAGVVAFSSFGKEF
ncbi:protein kinase domain-containing protein [Legionella jamestowniensis]|uniref:Protein kinase domain protein n=1 Tax=Legionella jamestowniensis TaxID=455 RepID=A0A0W0UTN9_9GAMM|nr:AarF/UbiB family protein [Legionella jamestowniensis]KTD11249.1 Protein kinase domain protein [Legionella jamestowniensis]SFL69990.1 Protein kinase domain-containing protein [Legionella jamestowniensis DSM 19215]